MSLNCTALQNKIMNSNVSDTLKVELDEDFTQLFGFQFWSYQSCWIGLVIVTFIIVALSFILSCIYLPRYDLKQKEIKLRELGIKPVLKHNISSHLGVYTKYNLDINNIIYEYANIPKHIDSIVASNITKKYIRELFISYLLLGIFLLASYIQVYMVIVHWQDSYLSYLKTECEIVDFDTRIHRSRNHRGQTTSNAYHGTTTAVYLNELTESCGIMQETFSFEVYSRYGDAHWNYDGKQDCYIHKDDLTVRQQPSGCCCCNEAVTKCGRDCLCNCCIDSECGGCANACGYYWLLFSGIIEVCCWWCCLFIMNGDEVKRRYKVAVKYEHLPIYGSEEFEYLL